MAHFEWHINRIVQVAITVRIVQGSVDRHEWLLDSKYSRRHRQFHNKDL